MSLSQEPTYPQNISEASLILQLFLRNPERTSALFVEQGFKYQQCIYNAITTMSKQLQSKMTQDQRHMKDAQYKSSLALLSPKPKT